MRGHREVGGDRRAGDVGVAGRVHRDAEPLVVRGAAKVGGVAEDRVDDEGSRGVPRGHAKADAVAVEHEATLDGPPRAGRLLIDDGASQPQLTGPGRQHQIAGIVQAQTVRAVEGEDDRRGVRAGRDHEVVLDLPLATVEEEADAGVHLVVAHSTEGRHVLSPARWLPDEVVAASGEWVDAADRHARIGADQTHPHDRRRRRDRRRRPRAVPAGRPLGRDEHEDGLARRQEQSRTRGRAPGTSHSRRPGQGWARTSAGVVPHPPALGPPRRGQPLQLREGRQAERGSARTECPGSGRLV